MISICSNELLDVLSSNCLLVLSQVEFSDESDSDVAAQADLKVSADVRKSRTSRRAAANPKTATDPPAEKAATRRPTRAKTTVAKPLLASSEEDEALLRRPASSRRGRSRKQPSKTDELQDELDTMRTIVEEADGVLDISIEQLRTSDAEENRSAADKDNSMCLLFLIEKH